MAREILSSPPFAVSVGASNTLVLDSAGSSERVDLLLTNASTGGQVISLAVGADAVASSGIVLQPTEKIGWSIATDYAVPQEQIRAIASAAGGSIAVFVRSR